MCCRLYLTDSYELENGEQHDIFTLKTAADDLLLSLDLTESQLRLEWSTSLTVDDFLSEAINYSNAHARAGALSAVDTEAGTVFNATPDAIAIQPWFPEYCSYFELDTTEATNELAWDSGPPTDSIILTNYTGSLDLFTDIFESTLENAPKYGSVTVDAVLEKIQPIITDQLNLDSP